jgi:large subunit ribosomal protein L35
MERLHQMGVVPDVLPDLHPSIDVRLTFPEAPPESVYLRTRVKRKPVPIEAGVMLLPEQVSLLYYLLFAKTLILLSIDTETADAVHDCFSS